MVNFGNSIFNYNSIFCFVKLKYQNHELFLNDILLISKFKLLKPKKKIKYIKI